MSFGSIPRRAPARGLGNVAQTSLSTASAPADAATEELRRLEGLVRAESTEQLKLEQRKARLDGQTAIAQAGNLVASEFAGDLNPDVEAYEARFQEATRPILDAITDEDVHDDLSAFADRTQLTRSGELMARVARNAQQQRAASVVENVRTLEITYGMCAAEDDECRLAAAGEILTNIGVAVAEGDMSPSVAQTLKDASARRRSGAFARGLINQDAGAAVEALEDDDNPFLRDMLPEQREILLAQAQRRVLQNQAAVEGALREARIEENAATRLKLARTIDVATPADFEDIQDTLDQELRNESILPGQHFQLGRALDARMEEYEEGVAEMTVVASRISGDFGVPLDPNNPDVKDAWDKIYRESLLPVLEELEQSGNPQMVAQGKAGVARAVGRMGFYPETLEGQVQDGLLSQNPGRFRESAEMYDAVSAEPNGQRINARAFTSLERMSMRMFNARLDGGASEGDALTDTFSVLGQAESLRDLNESLWREEEHAETAQSHLLSSLGEPFFPRFGRELGAVPRQMQADYVANVRALFLAGGGRDFKAARDAALEDIGSRWHLSETGTGGNAAWRVRAPELEYPVEGAPAGWHEEQLVEEIREVLKDPDLPTERIRIEADAMTALEVEPSYTVFILDEIGQRRDVVDPETFEHLAWRPEWLTSPAAGRLAEALVQGQADDEERVVRARDDRRFLAENPREFWKMHVGGVSIPISVGEPIATRGRRAPQEDRDMAEFPIRALRFLQRLGGPTGARMQ